MTYERFLEKMQVWRLQKFHATLNKRERRALANELIDYINEHIDEFKKIE